MMVIRPVERSDVSALMQLASKTGGGLTSLPANEATLSARIERAIKTWQGELPKSEQGYVFVSSCKAIQSGRHLFFADIERR
ncbi:arginine N-succinyltransferase, partial [Escherichia sp. TWPC-MK]